MTDKRVFEIHKSESDLQIAVAKLRNDLPQLVEIWSLKGPMVRAYYNSLVKEGFTEQQALELCSKAIF